MANQARLVSGRYFIDKDPDAELLYGFNLANWLNGDTLSTLAVAATGCVAESSAIAGDVVTAWVSGGTVGTSASITFSFTTAGGSSEDRTLHFNITQR